MGISTVSLIVKRVCNGIIRKLQREVIRFPDTEIEWQINIGKFAALFGMPNVAAAIDGSHIPIRCPPKESQRAYYNRKCFHSVVLQGTVNAAGAFMDVYCGWPGSVGDERIFYNSSLAQRIEADPSLLPKGSFMLGDKAYALTDQMMTPHKNWGHLPRHAKRFNKIHSQTRVVVESAFGALKGRWRRLNQAFYLALETLPDVIMACCILHNICVFRHDPMDADTIAGYVERERQNTANDFISELLDEFGDVNSTMEA